MKTPPASPTTNNRILVIDDNPAIHEDFRKVLSPVDSGPARGTGRGCVRASRRAPAIHATSIFQVDSAFQGQEGLEKVRAAVAGGAPVCRGIRRYADAAGLGRNRNDHPHLDGVSRSANRHLHGLLGLLVDENSKAIGNTDQVLVLKKPFDNIEVLQMAHALSKKWELTQMAPGRWRNWTRS